MGENKQVRVDNWGIFFLQRLQLFFSKTDYCDLTLQFQGNVQLKVHRLVLNACTEYFELLENSDRLIDDNVILMPDMLQADVAVPIINFMYTGMLEYPVGIHSKLYHAADLMRIPVLTKLLDAQRQPVTNKPEKPKVKTNKSSFMPTRVASPVMTQSKKTNKISTPELPPTLPGRKLPVWKRKTVPHTSNIASFSRSESRIKSDPLEDAAKPTRFEWPEDDLDLPPLDMMDLSDFGDISYTSKPLLIEDEVKPIIHSQNEINKITKEENHELCLDDRIEDSSSGTTADKRKLNSDSLIIDKSPKRIKIVESEKDTTISVISSDYSANFDPTKIVSEILKKYPHLVKKKKNIKLKILSKPKEKETDELTPEIVPVKKNSQLPQQLQTSVNKYESSISMTSSKGNSVWFCKECSENSGKPMEFMLYYLYRKHMTDVHNLKFDARICKYCGIALAKSDLHSYHLFTKHGIKPAGNQIFPSCSQCPFVALSKQALQIHKKKHKSTEMQCNECKLAFVNAEAISSHIQITGHMGKNRRSTFDCQYCTKTSQSSISLLSHIKSNHEVEGRRDGIVSLDEIDLEESADLDEDQMQEDVEGEYIIPEMKCQPVNKVKIISDVKVAATKSVNRTEIVTLDQSKIHTNVPGTIATSLGLLDIVVLDENQQFILQNQAEPSGENRTEFILPQISQRNVRADGLESSTDELVMMLTDQDYKDGHSAITTDNSNIVVLYSHPADGQQGQFITSQGNLMVNSETGLLEIRNGATIATTSASQIVLRESRTPEVETIEMIQREIAGSQALKESEEFYDDEQKPVVSDDHEEFSESTQVDEMSQDVKDGVVETPENVDRMEETEHQANEELKLPVHEVEMMDEAVEEPPVTPADMNASSEEFEILDNNSVDNRNESNELDNSTNSEQTESKDTFTTQEEVLMKPENTTSNEEQSGEEAILCMETQAISENNDESFEDTQRTIIVEDQPIEDSQRTIIVEPSMTIEEEKSNTDVNCENKTMEVDEVADLSAESIEGPVEPSQSNCCNNDEEKPYSPTDHPIDMPCDIESNNDSNEKQDQDSVSEQDNVSEKAQCNENIDEVQNSSEGNKVPVHCNDSLSEDEELDRNPQAVHEDNVHENVRDNVADSTTISILDDWEDTDSQHSDSKSKLSKKGAQETVHKLMDDWEEEEVEK